VTKVERKALRLTTIGAVDWNRLQRLEARKEAACERDRDRRARTGATPRKSSASALKPWLAHGYNNRRTWERNGKQPRVASSRAMSDGLETPNVANPCAPIGLHPKQRSELRQVPSTDTVQLSLLPPVQADDELRRALEEWHSGPMPETARVGYYAARRRRAVRQQDVAKAIGISRPQLAKAVRGTCNLSAKVIARLKAWLLVDKPTGAPSPSAATDPLARTTGTGPGVCPIRAVTARSPAVYRDQAGSGFWEPVPPPADTSNVQTSDERRAAHAGQASLGQGGNGRHVHPRRPANWERTPAAAGYSGSE
jgi:hypothetical protein